MFILFHFCAYFKEIDLKYCEGVKKMGFSFSLFEPKKERLVKNDQPQVEVRTNGRIVFNQKATELLNQNPYCMLGYDKDERALGILPMIEGNVNAFAIRYASKGAYVGAKRFFKHYGILPEQIIRNTPVQDNNFIGIKL